MSATCFSIHFSVIRKTVWRLYIDIAYVCHDLRKERGVLISRCVIRCSSSTKQEEQFPHDCFGGCFCKWGSLGVICGIIYYNWSVFMGKALRKCSSILLRQCVGSVLSLACKEWGWSVRGQAITPSLPGGHSPERASVGFDTVISHTNTKAANSCDTNSHLTFYLSVVLVRTWVMSCNFCISICTDQPQPALKQWH